MWKGFSHHQFTGSRWLGRQKTKAINFHMRGCREKKRIYELIVVETPDPLNIHGMPEWKLPHEYVPGIFSHHCKEIFSINISYPNSRVMKKSLPILNEVHALN